MLLASAASVLLAALATAAYLTPNSSGRGTHQQLGLPPCTFAFFVGQPCPSCGMTTSWAHLMDGQPLRAVQANFGGAILAIGAMVAAPWMLAAAIRGRFTPQRPSDLTIAGLTMAIAAVTLAQWAFRAFS